MSIEIVKLLNGETLLTEVTHEDDGYLHIIDPVQITVHTRSGSAPVCISTIWVPLTKEVNLFHIKQSAIILKSEVDEDMISYYNNCIDTIHESMKEDGSSTFFSSKPEDEDLTDEQIKDVLDKLLETGFGNQLTANTQVH